jgi:hypothetical protein
MGTLLQKFVQRHFHRLKTHPNPWLRKTIGILFVIGGLFGFLPVLGYWMIPVGLALLAVDWPWARRLSRQLISWWGRRARELHLKTQSAAQRRSDARSRDTRNGP